MHHHQTDEAREKLIKSMIDGMGSEKKLEELLDILIDEKFAMRYLHEYEDDSFADKMADKIAIFAGSWAFIIVFSIGMALWIVINELFLKMPFDPYPFILLNLILSLISSLQSPIIMMSQNRQGEKDRKRSEAQYNINLKNEVLLEDVHIKLVRIIEILEEQQKAS